MPLSVRLAPGPLVLSWLALLVGALRVALGAGHILALAVALARVPMLAMVVALVVLGLVLATC